MENENKKLDNIIENNICKECGYDIADGLEFCGECICEDDCGI